MALTKQFDFRVAGRGVLVDPTLPAAPANMTFTVDTVTIDGTQYQASVMDSTSITAIQNAVETAVQKNHRTQQTVTINSCSVTNGQTVIVTCGGLSVTYTNTGATVSVAATLGAALKTALDADAKWAARFDTQHSSGVLTITQTGNHTKVGAVAVTGTGTTSVTVAA